MEQKIEMKEYLHRFKEPMPEWLRQYKCGDHVSFAEFIGGRVGYYPGSGFDGTLIALCNRAHCVHSFLHVDYGLTREMLEEHLNERDCFKGYHSIGRVEWSVHDLTPNTPICNHEIEKGCQRYAFAKETSPYCFLEIHERDADKGDDWGAERFAVAFLFADGIATYHQLFVREYNKAPWIFLLQDHGFGGNYNRFGRNGILDRIIESYNCRPEYVICDEPANVWMGYKVIDGVNPIRRRMHRQLRYLFNR